MRVVSLLPAATEMVAALGALPRLVGAPPESVSPPEARAPPRVTRTRLDPSLPSAEIDRAMAAARRTGTPSVEVDVKLIAQRLPQDHIRAQLGDQLHVHLDGRCTGPPRRRHGAVDLGGGQRRVQPRAGDVGEGAGLRRVIALVGDPDQPGQRRQGRDQLGGRREDGDDPHALSLDRARRHCLRRPMRNSRAPNRPNRMSAGVFAVANAPRWWYHPTDSASQSAARPRALPAPAIAATTMPAMAPPAIIPLENRTPGPDSTSASDRFSDFPRCSTSHRTTPPVNSPADAGVR